MDSIAALTLPVHDPPISFIAAYTRLARDAEKRAWGVGPYFTGGEPEPLADDLVIEEVEVPLRSLVD